MTPINFHPEAADESRAAAARYENLRAGLGEDFRAELAAALARIRENPHLYAAECGGRPGELRRTIETVLGDAPRAGRRCRIEPDQVALIIAVACEPPEKSGRPISHWTHPELADEVVKRGIVPSISARHVGRFLKDRRPSTPSQSLLA